LSRYTPAARSVALAALASVLGARIAFAQVPDVAIARQLAIQGIDAVESGDCKKGAPLLERAEQMHHASVHLQYLARCRAAEGRLVVATEMWRQIIREGAPSGASPALVAAITEASTSLDHTLPRLATTTLRAAGEYPGLTLTLDGTAIPKEMVGGPQTLDPGEHELVAGAPGFSRWSHRWTVSEGGTAEVLITLTAGTAVTPTSPKEAPESRGSAFPLATVGWITGAVGAASLVAGTVTLLTRNNRRNELEKTCVPDKLCPSGYDLASTRDSIITLTTATNVLMFGGGALLAGGVTMIVVGSGSKHEPRTALLAGGPNATPGLTFRGNW
jgi:hypothetical protein